MTLDDLFESFFGTPKRRPDAKRNTVSARLTIHRPPPNLPIYGLCLQCDGPLCVGIPDADALDSGRYCERCAVMFTGRAEAVVVGLTKRYVKLASETDGLRGQLQRLRQAAQDVVDVAPLRGPSETVTHLQKVLKEIGDGKL